MTAVSLDRPTDRPTDQTVSDGYSLPSSQVTVAKGKKCGQVHKLRGTNKPGFGVEKKLKAKLFQATLVALLRSPLLRK